MIQPHAQPPAKGASRPPATAWLWSHRFVFTYLALAAWFVLRIAQFHDARTGFTPLEVFGDYFASQRIAPLSDLPLYTYRHSNGYDGQFYAQIAVAGDPFDPELRTALDAPAYRMRRILLPELAHLAGLGRPAAVLAAYALSNIVCWFILAWITARWWFRPTSSENLVRWVGTMFGAGMLVSTTRSLTDGPSLLVLAAGMRCLELNRRWLAAAVFGAGGLVRETSVLAAAAFAPPKHPARTTVVRDLLQGALCILPAVLWVGILAAHYRTTSGNQTGVGVLTFFKECRAIYSTLRARGLVAAKDDIYVVLALLVQLGFVLGRPRPTIAWWRVGAAFAVVPFFFGSAFWDDALDGVPRTILPLTLAFNVLAPTTRGGFALLLAGNLTALSAPRVLDVAPSEQTAFVDGITCDYASGWYQMEHLGIRTWRWASASAVLKVHNPQAGSLPVTIDFDVQSLTERTLTLYAGDARQVIPLRALHGVRAHFGPLELPPGDTSLGFDTTEPPWTEPGPRGRTLSFSVKALQITRVEPSN